MKISVIGGGSWGTTLACIAADNGHEVNLWAREQEVVDSINTKRENESFLPGIKIPENVKAHSSFENVFGGSELVILAIPSQFLRGTLKQITSFIDESAIIVDVAKGLEEGTYKRPSEIVKEELNTNKIVALSGPNHAEEVSRKIPTASVIASENDPILSIVKKVLSTNYFKTYPHHDIVGVEICGAVKNITAIATGICDGLGFGDNARGAIITLGLTEMNKFGRHFGAKRATCYGLAGVGDLVATCTSSHSRNRFVGEQIAKGKSMEDITKEMKGMVAEGVRTTKAVYEFCLKNEISIHLTAQVYKVLYEKKELKEAINDLIKLL